VKGVFFRAYTKEEADKLGIKGFVRNIDDGVEAVFEGDSEKLKKILEFCKRGSPYSKVEKVITKEENYTGEFKEFKILYF